MKRPICSAAAGLLCQVLLVFAGYGSQAAAQSRAGAEGVAEPAVAEAVSAEAGSRVGRDSAQPNDPLRIDPAAGVVLPAGEPKTDAASAARVRRTQPALIKGNDKPFKAPDVRSIVNVEGDGIALKFEQAPVTEVLHAVLGDIFKIDYAIVPPLSGEITLHTQGPVPRDQLLSILEALLLNNGIVMVPDVNGRYRIGRADILKTAVPLPRNMDTRSPGYGSVIIPLQNIGAAEMADILKPVAPSEAFVRVDPLRNLLVMAGTRNQVEGWLEIIAVFDVDLLKGMSVGLFPLEHSSVKDVESALRSLFASSGDGGGGGATRTAPAAPAPASGGKSDDLPITGVKLPGPLGGLLRVVAIERMNALLVVTPRAHYLEEARKLIEKFDKPWDTDGEPQLYVYAVQNGSALHLANLLNGLYAQSTTTSGTGATGVAPSLNTATQGANAIGSMAGASGALAGGLTGGFNTAGALGGNRTAAAMPSVTQVSLGKDIRVVADNHNNALLIHSPRRDYKRIEAALRQLDVTPNQVLIEASIVEVTLTDETKYGLQWYFEGGLGSGGWKGVGVLGNSTSGAINAAQQGFSYTITNPAGAVRAVLNAMADKQLVNVISSPSVMVLDNQTASIQVGDQQPVRSSTTVTDGGVSTSSIQYKDTGVLLSVTPSVNAGNLITMQINQTVSDVGSVDSATGQRSFLQRQIASKVAVRSGESIVLGGLIRDNNGRGKQGIPLLQDVPVLGALFGTSTLNKTRTELLVMITPRVMRNEQDVREVGSELRSKLPLLRPLLESRR